MTTQAIKAALIGEDFAVRFDKTATDDAWNEMVDETNSLSLGRVMEGKTIKGLVGYYTAGSAMIRIKKLDADGGTRIKEFLPLPIITEEKVTELENPITVERNDVIEVFCVAVPT